MATKNDELKELLIEIQESVERLILRVDEVENNMFEITDLISSNIKKIMKRADIRKKKKDTSRPAIVDMGDLIQE